MRAQAQANARDRTRNADRTLRAMRIKQRKGGMG